jgi:DNA-binding NtrC family response regulator
MWSLCKLIGLAAATDAPVLITGEPGSGKELAARVIHEHSSRSDSGFVVAYCASVPLNLQEVDIFGHERVGFAGSYGTHPGKIERAVGGTLFLDRIEDAGPVVQAKVLRVLREKSFLRAGGMQARNCNVRIIASACRDLRQEVHRGSFREDLYYRLNVVHVAVPSLSRRKEDIPDLCRHLLTDLSAEFGAGDIAISEGALRRLQEYDWPGNVAELREVLSTAVSYGGGPVILPQHIDLQRKGPGIGTTSSPGVPRPNAFPEAEYGPGLLDVRALLLLQAIDWAGGSLAGAFNLLDSCSQMLRRDG